MQAARSPQEAMRLAVATIANGSVGEFVIPDSNAERHQTAAVAQPRAQWPPEDDESDETDEEVSVIEQPRNEGNAMPSTIQANQDEAKIEKRAENTESTLMISEYSTSIDPRNKVEVHEFLGSELAKSYLDPPMLEPFEGISNTAYCVVHKEVSGKEIIEPNNSSKYGRDGNGVGINQDRDFLKEIEDDDDEREEKDGEDVSKEKEAICEGYIEGMKSEGDDNEASFRIAIAQLRNASPQTRLTSSVRHNSKGGSKISRICRPLKPIPMELGCLALSRTALI